MESYVLADYVVKNRHNIFEGRMVGDTVILSPLNVGYYLEVGGTLIMTVYRRYTEKRQAEYLMKVAHQKKRMILLLKHHHFHESLGRSRKAPPARAGCTPDVWRMLILQPSQQETSNITFHPPPPREQGGFFT